MAVVQVTEAGRIDQENVTTVVHSLEAQQNPNAVVSVDQNAYDPYPDRCIQMKLGGGRCKGRKLPKQHLCMVHATKEPVDDED